MIETPRRTFITSDDVVRAAANHIARDPDEAGRVGATVALDMQSVQVREVIAKMIDPGLNLAGVLTGVSDAPAFYRARGDQPESRVRTARLLRSLAQVLGLQRFLEEDEAHAVTLFRAARYGEPVAEWATKDVRVFSQLLWFTRDHDALRSDDELRARLPKRLRHFLEIDLEGSAHGVGSAGWLTKMNETLVSHGVSPIQLASEANTPFDRLQPSVPRGSATGPLVSVVMPAFRPGLDILTAVRSIVDQTWADWELLVVDDASGPDFAHLFSRVERVDPRIRVIRQPVNRGTYAARNRALDEARGEFVAFQDIDDWSHPERLERQVRPLLDDPALLRTQSLSIRCTDELVFQYLGADPIRPNASSQMFRRSVLDVVGRFDWVRKSADSEFDRRLEAAFPGRQRLIPETLAFIRLEPDSLSRGDFRPGWMHPSRVEYRAAMLHWHRQIEAGANPRIPSLTEPRPLTAPRPFLRDLGLPAQPIDIAFMADWTMDGNAQRAGLDEMAALQRAGKRVGLLHVRSIFSDAPPRAPLTRSARRAIASGTATFVSLEEADHIPTIMVRQPDVLEFLPARPPALTTDHVVIVADSDLPPTNTPGPCWRPGDCDRNAESLFGIAPFWAVRGVPRVATDVPGNRIVDHDYPEVLDVMSWATARQRGTRDRPVVSWASLPGAMPDLATVTDLFPLDDTIDVRMIGSRDQLARSFEGGLPTTWLVYAVGEITTRELFNQVDFVVGFPADGPNTETLRTVHEALAAGCVAVLDQRFEPFLADAALYCEAPDAPSLIHELHVDRQRFFAQSRQGRRWAQERFADSNDALTRYTHLVVSHPTAETVSESVAVDP